jgi:hypothetical protein
MGLMLKLIFGSIFLSIISAPIFFLVAINDAETLQKLTNFERRAVTIAFPVGFSVSVVIGLLIGFQAYLIVSEQSTIEYYAKGVKSDSVCRRTVKILAAWTEKKSSSYGI